MLEDIDNPNQTDTQKKVVDTTKDTTNTQVQQQVQSNVNKNVNVAKDSDVVTTTTVDKKPTGEEITTTKTETKTHEADTDKTQAGTKTATKDATVDQKTSQDNILTDTKSKSTFQETITQSQPRWMVGVFGGLDTSGLSLNGNALVTGPLMYGTEGGYRFLGPIWVDAKVMKTGAGLGVAAGLQLQF